MTITQGTPLLDKLEAHKKKLKDRAHRKAERKHLRRGWLKEKHADIHTGANTEAFRAGYDAIFGKDKWAKLEEIPEHCGERSCWRDQDGKWNCHNCQERFDGSETGDEFPEPHTPASGGAAANMADKGPAEIPSR
jgi:hypothetical protein